MALELRAQLSEFPVVTLLGPRQSGKTTLVRDTFPTFDYQSLEDPDARRLAEEDPRGFLARYPRQAIFDEIQRAPQLLSYLQGIVDESGGAGQFVITGSHQLLLREAISQSLAGRTGVLQLLPLSIPELEAAGLGCRTFEEYVFRGFLPRVHSEKQRARTAYAAYYQTYVERDVRLLIQLKDATLFEKFMKLLAGRVGQLVNASSLASEVGVDSKTIGNWLSILEASFVIFKLPPYFENFGKRVIKSPKYYFTDTGLLSHLLGFEEAEHVTRDPLVGSLFENLVVLEALKARLNRGRAPELYFFRDSHGREIDLLHRSGRELTGIEVKSASTYHPSFKNGLRHFGEHVHPLARSYVVYNGDSVDFSDGVRALPFSRTSEIFGG